MTSAVQPTAEIGGDPHRNGLSAAARDLSRDFAATAVARERADLPPYEEIQRLREAGLLRASAPPGGGGAGRRGPEVRVLGRLVAAGDTSIGHLLAYHHINLLSAVLCAGADDGAPIVARSAREGWFWGDAVNPRDPAIVLTRDGDGYRADGRKTFTTGSAVADRLFVSAELDGVPVALHVPADRSGVTFDRAPWDFIGQRLTESGHTILAHVRVEPDEILGGIPDEDGPLSPHVTILIPVIQSAFAAIYVGAARGALTDAAEYVRTTTRPGLHSGVDRAARDPLVVERFGRHDARLRAAEALVGRAAEQVAAALDLGDALDERTRGEVAVTVSAAKAVSTEVALEVTAGVFEVQGARSAHRDLGLDRRWRDVRTHTLHDPVFYKVLEVGELALNDAVPEPDGNRYR